MTRAFIAAALALASVPALAQRPVPPSGAVPQLTEDQRTLLHCSATFALVSGRQHAGDKEALAFPDITARGREYFVCALVELMDRPSWVDEAMATVAGRQERADEIDGRLQDWFATQSRDSAVERLAAAGIPAAPVVSPSLVTENPQLRDRGFFEELDHCRTGAGLYPCPPFAQLAGQRRWLYRPPPTLGQHNEEVLRDRCGLTDEELARLAASGVIGTRPKGA